MTNMKEIYVSVDIESDGPIPGSFSMLSLGSVAFGEKGQILSTFSINLTPLPDAKQHPNTMKWWATKPEAWERVQENQVNPEIAMRQYHRWLMNLPGKTVFVGYPASYDFMFVYWYLIFFVGESPFGFQALDLKTAAWAYMGGKFKDVSKSKMPKEWKNKRDKHTHIVLDDAKEQGQLFLDIKDSLGDLRRE